MFKLPKAIYRLNAIPTKNTNGIFYRSRTSNFLKFVWNQRDLLVAKTILRKRNKAGCLMLPDFSLYYKATVIKTI